MHEKPSLDCENPPKVVAFGAGTHMERGFSACPLTCCRSSGFWKKCSGKRASSSRGDAVLRKSPNVEDRANYKGRMGFDHRGSSVTIFPSIPVIREKGLNFVGTYGMLVAENLEVSSSSHSQSSLSTFPPPFGLPLPSLSPSVPVLPSSVIYSHYPMKTRVISKFFFQKRQRWCFLSNVYW